MREGLRWLLIGVLTGAGVACAAEKPLDLAVINEAKAPAVRITLDPNGQDHGYCLWFHGANDAAGERVQFGDWYRGATAERGASAPFVTNCVVSLQSRNPAASVNVNYHLLPWYGPSGLFYDKEIAANWNEWMKTFVPYSARTFTLEVEPDRASGRNLCSLNGSPLGFLGTTGRIEKVVLKAFAPGMKASVRFGAAKEPDRTWQRLKSVAGRTSPVLPANAAISLRPGEQTLAFGGEKVLVDVWPVSESADMGRWQQPRIKGTFGFNAMLERTPCRTAPYFTQWTVPDSMWCTAWILCARLPQEGRVGDVGTRVTRLGPNCNSSNWADAHTDLGATPANARKVGSFTYTENGVKKTEPLWLVRQNLNVGNALAILNDKEIYGGRHLGVTNSLSARVVEGFRYVDFELIGSFPWNDSIAKSDVQVFGITLESAPFMFDTLMPVKGNLFTDEKVKKSGFEFTALRDNAKGSLAWEIQDDAYRTLARDEQAFTLAKKGERREIFADLSKYGNGWYRIVWTVKDGDGRELCTHNAAFTILGHDTREAGLESPYACWPQGVGYEKSARDGTWGFYELGRHASNPNRMEVIDVMRKAGYHTAWHPPVKDEAESKAIGYPITLSAVARCCNLDRGRFAQAQRKDGTTLAQWVSNRLDEAVVTYREIFSRYPSCDTIQLLHEDGGRDLAACMLEPGPARVECAYRGAAGEDRPYWCTEFCTRMRKEFPGKKICVGNGSSASEMISHLCRNGFDLNLVDQLGIESKGFQTMPELKDNREAPGMLWALRETARKYGFTNFTMNACNEYVFRPERQESMRPDDPRAKRMMVTDYTLRDYLLSLAWGCRTISTGHLEDCNTAYYGSNWGAGGQCTTYPYSYPKRMFTALATFTKVFDKCGTCRRIPTGEVSTYALEFPRNRAVKDFASAYWTPVFDAQLAVQFPSGTTVEKIDWQGRAEKLTPNGKGVVTLDIGSTPVYLVTSKPAIRGQARHAPAAAPGDFRPLASFAKVSLTPTDLPDYGGNFGTFETSVVRDAELGRDVLETRLVRTPTPIADIAGEHRLLLLDKPIAFDPSAVERLGLWIRGNGGFGSVSLVLADDNAVTAVKTGRIKSYARQAPQVRFGVNGVISYHGWQFVESGDLARAFSSFCAKDGTFRRVHVVGVLVNDCRKALDPIEMAPVEDAIRLGELMVAARPGASLPERGDAGDNMKDVDDKDL